ncbi:MAG: SHOCT domain-containing protein, partial [Candidatus Poseidoniia archaeon]|nr:SHOCT domain-containing protein [Candidatus Poseidoniia archaeon]
SKEENLDYESAISLWEQIGDFKKSKEVRRKMLDEKKVDQTIVHGDYVDDRDTIVKDSVLNRSNVGGGSSKMQELKELKEMLAEGLIDDDEFKQMKKEILGK